MILEAKNLSIGYRSGNTEINLLNNANFQLQRGFVYSIFGANGIGKSTLIHTLCGIIQPLKGEVLVNHFSLSKISKKELAKKISIVLTERPMVEYMSVFDFVALGRTPHTGFTGYLTPEDRQIVNESMELATIQHKKNQQIDSLSDGEFQKALIAKALSQQTPIIIMDEPASYLDFENQIQLMTLLQKLAIKAGKTILLSLHHINLAIDFSHYMFLFNNDRTLTMGTPEDLILCDKFNDIYQNQDIFFDNNEGSFKNSTQIQDQIQIEAPDLQKKWIHHALIKNGIYASPFLVRYTEGEYSILQNGMVLETVTTIAKLVERLKDLKN